MSEPSPLTAEETATLRAALAEGKQPTVWFTSAAVGVDAGRSGKVTALGEPAEGDFIQVRPTGSKDVLSFEAAEITVVRPPRQRKAAAKDEKPATEQAVAPATSPSGTTLGLPPWSDVGPGSEPSASTGARNGHGANGASKDTASATITRSTSSRPAAAAVAPAGQSAVRETVTGQARNGAGPKRGGSSRSPRPVEMTVTLVSTIEGEWTIDVLSGKKRVAKAMPISASLVAKVAKILPPDVEDAIDSALDAAREQQRSRVEQLQAELAEAKRNLDELFG